MEPTLAEKEHGAVERCVAEVVQGIRHGALRPAHKLGEESFAKKMGVDRASVRLAFDRLVTAGLLERVHRSGTFVRRIDFQEFCEAAEVRAVLEGLAGSLASKLANDTQLQALGVLADKLDRFASQSRTKPKSRAVSRQWEMLEMDFHEALAQLSANRALCRVLSFHHLIDICFMTGIVHHALDASQEQSVPQHVAIVAALKSRDSARAEQIIRSHILLAKDSVIRQSSNLRTELVSQNR